MLWSHLLADMHVEVIADVAVVLSLHRGLPQFARCTARPNLGLNAQTLLPLPILGALSFPVFESFFERITLLVSSLFEKLREYIVGAYELPNPHRTKGMSKTKRLGY